MAGRGKKIYKSPKPGKILIHVLAALLAAIVVLAIVLFFYLKKFIVIKGDDVHLAVPFLEEVRQESLPEADIVIEE